MGHKFYSEVEFNKQVEVNVAPEYKEDSKNIIRVQDLIDILTKNPNFTFDQDTINYTIQEEDPHSDAWVAITSGDKINTCKILRLNHTQAGSDYGEVDVYGDLIVKTEDKKTISIQEINNRLDELGFKSGSIKFAGTTYGPYPDNQHGGIVAIHKSGNYVYFYILITVSYSQLNTWRGNKQYITPGNTIFELTGNNVNSFKPDGLVPCSVVMLPNNLPNPSSYIMTALCELNTTGKMQVLYLTTPHAYEINGNYDIICTVGYKASGISVDEEQTIISKTKETEDEDDFYYKYVVGPEGTIHNYTYAKTSDGAKHTLYGGNFFKVAVGNTEYNVGDTVTLTN